MDNQNALSSMAKLAQSLPKVDVMSMTGAELAKLPAGEFLKLIRELSSENMEIVRQRINEAQANQVQEEVDVATEPVITCDSKQDESQEENDDVEYDEDQDQAELERIQRMRMAACGRVRFDEK